MSFNPLQELFEDEKITEIWANGASSIYYEKEGEIKVSPQAFPDQMEYQRFLQNLLEEAQVKLDLESPFASFSWKSFRGHLSHPPLSKDHHLLTLRRIRRSENHSLRYLFKVGTLNESHLFHLKRGVRERKNILIVGATGSGKTTTLSALLKELDNQSRVLILEDTDEIDPPNPLSAKLLTRETSPALRGYDLGQLLKESLRMKPDRLVVGEVRGGEAKDLLMALSTGHQGSFATLHASSAQEALLRLEMLIQMGAPQWSLESIRKLMALTLDWIVVLEFQNNQRQIEGVYEITSLESVGFLTHKMA